MPIPDLAPPPLPEELVGYDVRVPGVDDIDALYALGRASDEAVIGTAMITRAEIEQAIVSPTAKEDSRQLLVERGGVAISWPWIEQVNPERLAGDVQVHPDLDRREADALVSWGLDWFERTARANFDSPTPPERIQLGNWCFQEDARRPEQLRRAGYQSSRAFIRMTRDIAPGERYPQPAKEISVRQAIVDVADPDAGDTRLMHSIISTSFADHYNYTTTPFELWLRRRADDPGFDPSLWFLAEYAGKPLAAMIMNRELEEEQNAGYVHYLGVLREGRGRGLAKALLYRGFAVSRDEGKSAVKLFVDAESPTGATRLYESVGMTREQVVLEWQKWLTRDSG
jgi:ribosomal protein S18 acetylase RimI-like enzyme